jgi:hypothetical protein
MIDNLSRAVLIAILCATLVRRRAQTISTAM